MLLENTQQLQRKGGKLTERFKGPYIVRRCLGKGVYELETKDGKVLKTKHNMNRLRVLCALRKFVLHVMFGFCRYL